MSGGWCKCRRLRQAARCGGGRQRAALHCAALAASASAAVRLTRDAVSGVRICHTCCCGAAPTREKEQRRPADGTPEGGGAHGGGVATQWTVSQGGRSDGGRLSASSGRAVGGGWMSEWMCEWSDVIRFGLCRWNVREAAGDRVRLLVGSRCHWDGLRTSVRLARWSDPSAKRRSATPWSTTNGADAQSGGVRQSGGTEGRGRRITRRTAVSGASQRPKLQLQQRSNNNSNNSTHVYDDGESDTELSEGQKNEHCACPR